MMNADDGIRCIQTCQSMVEALKNNWKEAASDGYVKWVESGIEELTRIDRECVSIEEQKKEIQRLCDEIIESGHTIKRRAKTINK